MPATFKVLLKVTADVGDPTHKAWLDSGSTVGVGFTVIVKFSGNPVHVIPALVKLGVTDTVAVIGVFDKLVAGKDDIALVPDEGKLIDVLSFVHV